MESNAELDLDSYATLDEYEVIPRPQELIKTQQLSTSAKEKYAAKESSLRKKLLQKQKELLSFKEKFLTKDGKKSTARVKSRSSPLSAPKASGRTKNFQEIEQKFDSYVQGAKKSLKKGSPRPEASKSTKEDPEKVKPSQSKDDISKQELQLLKSMEEVAETAQERYDVLNARDSFLRLNESKKGETKVKKVSGTCPDMCPEKERYSRIAKNCLAIFETKMAFDSMGSSKDVDHRYMVKEYSRSSADQQEPLPHELRPVSVLKFTMDYLICNIIDRKNTNISIADWYDFIWNRTRSIRKDITQQQLCDVECVDILEKCARFHILCAELLSEEDTATFDPKINNENLTKCLQTLKHMYHDLQTKGIQCPNEAEFRAYDILLSLTEGETLRLVKDIRKEVFNSSPVKTAFEAALAFKSNNYVKFFKFMEKGTYLDSCILHRYIPEARFRAMQVIERAYCVPNNATMLPLKSLVKDLKFENVLDAANFCKWHGLTVDETHVTIQRQTFQKPSSVYPVARATCLVGNKLQTSLSEIINNGPLPENPLEWYRPRDSFNEEGLLLNKFSVSDISENKREDIQGMDIDEVNISTIPIQPTKTNTSQETKIEQDSLKLDQKKFSTSVTKSSSILNTKSDHSFLGDSKNNCCESSSNSKKATSISPFSQKVTHIFSPSRSALRKLPPLTTLDARKAADTFKPQKFQGSVFEKLSSESWTFFPTTSCLSSSFSFRSPILQSTNFRKEASETNTLPPHSTSIFNSSIPVTKEELIAANSLKSTEIQDIIEIEDSLDQGIGSETDINEKEKEIEVLYDDYSRMKSIPFVEKADNDSLSLAMEDEETLNKLREEKLEEIISDISDEIYSECIEDLSAQISESTVKEEWDKKVEYEDALEKIRAVLAKKTIFKWRLFCERRKHRRMFQNTEPLSPWIPMLTNTEYVTSGASSPFSVYKKHCSLSRLTETKLKERDNRPGWESFSSSHFEMLNKIPRFPPAYLKKVGINRFFKLCILFVSYPNYSLSTFIDWMCKKFKLSALSENLDKKSNLLSFYTLNGGKTLMCIQAIVLDKNMDMNNTHLLNGLSAMMLCVPARFPDSLNFNNTLELFKILLKNNCNLLPFPLVAFLLGSSEKISVVNQLTTFLDNRLYSGNIFSTVKKKELSNPANYRSNSNEILGAVRWLIENQEHVPIVQNSSLHNYLEDSFASVFSTVFWKLSLQEFKPLSQMPQQVISFYNKLLECRASLLCSSFLIAIARWWPPQELFTLQPEYRFIDVSFQRKSAEYMKALYLPEFIGDPYSLNDLWNYVNNIADLIDSGREALLLSVQSILRISTDIDWPSIISKCAYFILCHFCNKFGSCVNEDVFYMKPDLESINLDSFWQSLLYFLKENHPFNKRKRPESELKENSAVKKIRTNKDTELVEEICDTNWKDQYASSAPAISVSDFPDAASSRVDNLLSSLKSALKKQNEESDRFLLKLNESVSDQSFFSESIKEDLSLVLDYSGTATCEKLQLDSRSFILDKNSFTEQWSGDTISSMPKTVIEANKNKDSESSDVMQKLLGRKLPNSVTSPSSLSEKLLELKYNIQRNNILEDNLGLLLKL